MPVTPMRIEADAQGYTRVSEGAANVSACLASDPAKFFRFLMPRLLASRPTAQPSNLRRTAATP